jgi:ferric-dicitrate binding protein FerR (iron transport regulator)
VVAVRLSTTPDVPAPGATLATVVVLEGTARLVPEAEPPGPARNLAVATSIRTGDLVETSATGRLGLQLIGGPSLRLDVATRARLRPAAIELVEGGIYVDNPSGGAGLAVRTPLGTVQDIGTQFEVRVGPSSLRVRVRSGIVALRWSGEEASGSPGAELTVEDGRLIRRESAVHGAAWAWTLGLAPAIAMDGRTLEAVLEDLCREHGWTRRYAEPALRREATTLILNGRLDGLSPEQALDAVFGATDLSYRLQNGEILISRATGRLVP